MSLLDELNSRGYALVENAVEEVVVEEILRAIAAAGLDGNSRDLGSAAPEILRLCRATALCPLANEALETKAVIVRSLLFDKTPSANWVVAWHQDVTIAVKERRDVPGFGPWSVKAHIPHVQPPAEILARMITLRLHLDDCDESNGALQVLPGTHLCGKLGSAEIRRLRAEISPAVCAVRKGGVLLMRPLLLHASSKAEQPRHRRVVHLEFAGENLPGGLCWLGRDWALDGDDKMSVFRCH